MAFVLSFSSAAGASELKNHLHWTYAPAPLPNGPDWVHAKFLSYRTPAGKELWKAELSPKRSEFYHYGATLPSFERPPAVIGAEIHEGNLVIADVGGLWILNEATGKTVKETFLEWPKDEHVSILWFDSGEAEVTASGSGKWCKPFKLHGGRFLHTCGGRFFYFNGYHAVAWKAAAPFELEAQANYEPKRDSRKRKSSAPGAAGEIPVGPYIFRLAGVIFVR